MHCKRCPIKVALAPVKMSVPPTVSLRGFEMVSPAALSLERGAGAVHASGQHLWLSSQDEVTNSEGCLGSDLP